MQATRSLRLTAYVALLVIASAVSRRRGAVRSIGPPTPPMSERDYRLLFERSPVAMWIYDLETLAILEANDAALAHYGHSRDEFLALTMKEIEPGSQVRTIGHDVMFLERPARFVLAQEVGERDRLDEQLRQAQRMEAIARFASGVAHDFNNLVMVMTGHSDVLLANTPPDDARRGQAEEIKKAADRAAALTRQLLTVGRAQGAEPVVLDLDATVAGLEPRLRRSIGSNIEIEIRPGAGVSRVRADRGQIEQVLVDLAVNASDAMPAGGTLTIATTDVDLDADYFRDHPASEGEPGRYTLLEVADTGVGIDAATMSHVFEPFHTTTAEGHGTGLGLAAAYGIVAESRGFLWASSEPGRGTSFKVYLPAAAPAVNVQPERRLVAPLTGAGRTVLLVEDDTTVRAGVRRMLEAEGFTILEAAEGAAALALSEAGDPDSLGVLVADTILPGPGGVDLAHRVRHRHPALCTVIMSGYPEERFTTGGNALGPRTEFLGKPFTAAALHAKLAALLLGPD
jgi:two-component system cell cycle sensor histidine kinase/response regulator CckA